MEQLLSCIAAASQHSLVISPVTSEVFSFGSNKYGQLGVRNVSGSSRYLNVLDPETNMTRWRHMPIQIASGLAHGLLLLENGTVYSWGLSEAGRLGIEETRFESRIIDIPTAVQIPRKICFIACGGDFNLAIAEGNTEVYSWGLGKYGNLGHGTTNNEPLPKLITGLEGKFIRMVAAGVQHSMCVAFDGTVFSWGNGENGRLGHNSLESSSVPIEIRSIHNAEIVVVRCGDAHSACISKSGHLFTWGSGTFGRLGHGNESDSHFPSKITSLAGNHVVDVSLGTVHSVCTTTQGDVWAWGSAKYRKLGTDRNSNATFPIKVTALSGSRIVQVSAGGSHTLAVGEHHVYSWGNSSGGKLGRMTNMEPMDVGLTSIDPFVQKLEQPILNVDRTYPEAWAHTVKVIAVGSKHSMALTYGGSVYGWGSNSEGQLGTGNQTDSVSPIAVSVVDPRSGLQKVTNIATGSRHTLCCTDSGSVFVWGRGAEMQLGLGNDAFQVSPKILDSFTGETIEAVYAGESHSGALTKNGELFTWGSNSFGKLGLGSLVSHFTNTKVGTYPEKIAGVLQGRVVVQVSLGWEHSACVDKLGSVFTWGNGWNGKLGLGHADSVYEPCRVLGLQYQRITKVSCGAHHTLFVSTESDLYVCGRGDARLGLGITDDCMVPEIHTQLRASGVLVHSCAAAENHSVIVTQRGRVFTWGSNDYSKLGRGMVKNDASGLESTPSQVSNIVLKVAVNNDLPDDYYVAAFSNHNIAMSQDGVLYGWGYNGNGRLGVDEKGMSIISKPREICLFPLRPHLSEMYTDADISILASQNHIGSKGEGMELGYLGKLDELDRNAIVRHLTIYLETNKTPPIYVVQLFSRAQEAQHNLQAATGDGNDTVAIRGFAACREHQTILEERIRHIAEKETELKSLQYLASLIVRFSVKYRSMDQSSFAHRNVFPERIVKRFSMYEDLMRCIFANPACMVSVIDATYALKKAENVTVQQLDWTSLLYRFLQEVFEDTESLYKVNDFATTKEMYLIVLSRILIRVGIEEYFIYGRKVDDLGAKMSFSKSYPRHLSSGSEFKSPVSASEATSSFANFSSQSLASDVVHRLMYILFSQSTCRDWFSECFRGTLQIIYGVNDADEVSQSLASFDSLETDPIVVYQELTREEIHQPENLNTRSEIYQTNHDVRTTIDKRVAFICFCANDLMHALRNAVNKLPLPARLFFKVMKQELLFQFASDPAASQARVEYEILKMFTRVALILPLTQPNAVFGKEFGKVSVKSRRNMIHVIDLFQNIVAGRVYQERWLRSMNSVVENFKAEVTEISSQLPKLIPELSDVLYINVFNTYVKPYRETEMARLSLQSFYFLEYVLSTSDSFDPKINEIISKHGGFFASGDEGRSIENDNAHEDLIDLLHECQTSKLPGRTIALPLDMKFVNFMSNQKFDDFVIDKRSGVPLTMDVSMISCVTTPFSLDIGRQDADFRQDINRTLAFVFNNHELFSKTAHAHDFLLALKTDLHVATEKGQFTEAAELHRIIKHVESALRERKDDGLDEMFDGFLNSLLWEREAASRIEYVTQRFIKTSSIAEVQLQSLDMEIEKMVEYVDSIRNLKYSDLTQLPGFNKTSKFLSLKIIPKSKRNATVLNKTGTFVQYPLTELLKRGVVLMEESDSEESRGMIRATSVQFTSVSTCVFEVAVVQNRQFVDKFTLDAIQLLRDSQNPRQTYLKFTSAYPLQFSAFQLNALIEESIVRNLFDM